MAKRETRDILDVITGDTRPSRTPAVELGGRAALRPVTTQLDDATKTRLEATLRRRYGLALSAGIRMVLLQWLERES